MATDPLQTSNDEARRRRKRVDSVSFFGLPPDKFSGQQQRRRVDIPTMSETGTPNANGPGVARYSTDCRNCDHTVRARIPVGAVQHNVEGVRVRCGECRTTNFIRREDPGNE